MPTLEADPHQVHRERQAEQNRTDDGRPREVAEAAGTLYEDKAAVREIEDFFLAAIDAARRGAKLAGWPQ